MNQTLADQAPVFSIEHLLLQREKNGFKFRLQIPKLDIHRGEFVAIVGESGCGKSTLLDMLGLILSPSASARFEFRPRRGTSVVDISAMSERQLAAVRRKHLGYVLQGGGLLPYMSVADNIGLAARLRNGSFSEGLQLTDFGIGGQARKKPQHLSGGQRQRVAIARALAGHPEVILADEPTAAVDRPMARNLCEMLARYAKEQDTTVIMVTHDLDLLVEIATRWLTFDLETSIEGQAVTSILRELNR